MAAIGERAVPPRSKQFQCGPGGTDMASAKLRHNGFRFVRVLLGLDFFDHHSRRTTALKHLPVGGDFLACEG